MMKGEETMSLNMFSLEGKVAVVTGGSRGLGRAMALGLADAGADVVVASRTQADLDKVAEEIRAKGRKSLAIAMDSSSLESISNMAEKTIGEFGKIGFELFGCHGPMLAIVQFGGHRVLVGASIGHDRRHHRGNRPDAEKPHAQPSAKSHDRTEKTVTLIVPSP